MTIANSTFQHPARHITMWENTRILKDNSVKHIYNQIDYILCPNNKKHTLINARSFNGLKTFSAHRLVKCTICTAKSILFLQHNKQKSPNNRKPIDCASLTNNEELRNAYKQTLNEKLQNDPKEIGKTYPTLLKQVQKRLSDTLKK